VTWRGLPERRRDALPTIGADHSSLPKLRKGKNCEVPRVVEPTHLQDEQEARSWLRLAHVPGDRAAEVSESGGNATDSRQSSRDTLHGLRSVAEVAGEVVDRTVRLAALVAERVPAPCSPASRSARIAWLTNGSRCKAPGSDALSRCREVPGENAPTGLGATRRWTAHRCRVRALAFVVDEGRSPRALVPPSSGDAAGQLLVGLASSPATGSGRAPAVSAAAERREGGCQGIQVSHFTNTHTLPDPSLSPHPPGFINHA
jgi:hypothetical protein